MDFFFIITLRYWDDSGRDLTSAQSGTVTLGANATERDVYNDVIAWAKNQIGLAEDAGFAVVFYRLTPNEFAAVPQVAMGGGT